MCDTCGCGVPSPKDPQDPPVKDEEAKDPMDGGEASAEEEEAAFDESSTEEEETSTDEPSTDGEETKEEEE
ncbi:MAG: hypothetical protein ABIE03_02835 [Patescibacteria group bacterium]|nr:hypothetical protein [Patescibacteria group bacterium]